jgi:threonine dehydrogenase-like Zn-dependent dehydrogenase
MNFNNKRVGVIGAGAMGSAMIRGFLKAGLMQPQDMIASDLRDNALQELKRSTSINITSDNSAVVQRSQVIIFAVKPDQVENTGITALPGEAVIDTLPSIKVIADNTCGRTVNLHAALFAIGACQGFHTRNNCADGNTHTLCDQGFQFPAHRGTDHLFLEQKSAPGIGCYYQFPHLSICSPDGMEYTEIKCLQP